MEESVGSLPDHRWEIKLKSNSYVASLIMPPYVFKRKVNKKVGLISSFSCNTCERLKPPVIRYAKAIKVSENEDGKPSYKLLRVPDNHECLPSSVNVKSREFYPICQRIIDDKATTSIGIVYSRCGHVVRDFESEAKTRYNF